MKKNFFIRVLCLSLFLFLLACAGTASAIEINEENFPDATFRSFVSTNFDFDRDNELSESERVQTSIIMDATGMSSLQGINHFSTTLQYLSFWSGDIESVDLFECLQLVSLDCVGNNLTQITLPSNLQYLNCSHNKITSLDDLISAESLVSLDCSNNNLTYLTLDNCTSLKYLECGNNQLQYIHGLDNLANIEEIGAWANNLSSLTFNSDVNVNLKHLRLYNSGTLTYLDLSGLSSLVSAEINSNNLTHVYLQSNDALQFLHVSNNSLPYLDASSTVAPNLTQLWCNSQDYDAHYSSEGSQYIIPLGRGSIPVVISDMENVQILDSGGNAISYSATASGDAFVVSSEPSILKYDIATYNTYTPSMDVTVNLSLVSGSIAISSVNFPDANFRSYISTNFDTDYDGFLSASEISAVTRIDVADLSCSA